MSYYESLQEYFNNGCVLHPGTPPKWGEAGYAEYIRNKITKMGIKAGDVIRVEEKWHNGTCNRYEGIVLHIYKDRLYMLSHGNKVWKDHSNRKDVVFGDITEIEKIKEAKPDFDIYKTDPGYKILQNSNVDGIEKSLEPNRIKRFKERMRKNFPQIDIDNKVVLWMLFDFCWVYSNGSVLKADINIIAKDGNSIPVPSFKNKHIYPNHSYYSACGINNTDEKEDGILLFFDSFEELEKIRLISCTWTVEVEGKQRHFLQMLYPKFIKAEGNVFNLTCRCTDMGEYEHALHYHSTFQESLENDYDKAFVYISDSNCERIIKIMNANDVTDYIVLDAVLSLHHNNMISVVESLQDNKPEIAEVFLKNIEIEGKGYIWPF